jgi:hypothetical protein
VLVGRFRTPGSSGGRNGKFADQRRPRWLRRNHRQDSTERPCNPPGKLADAELHFTNGPLDGLKLIGFSIWERRGGTGRNVTFPARQYSVNGERRSFALLRPIVDTTAQDSVRDRILEAYAEYEEAATAPA